MFKLPINKYQDNIFWTAPPFVTKVGIVVQDHELVRHSKRLIYYCHSQGHSDGSCSTKYGCFYHIHWTVEPDQAQRKYAHIALVSAQWGTYHAIWQILFTMARNIFSECIGHIKPLRCFTMARNTIVLISHSKSFIFSSTKCVGGDKIWCMNHLSVVLHNGYEQLACFICLLPCDMSVCACIESLLSESYVCLKNL